MSITSGLNFNSDIRVREVVHQFDRAQTSHSSFTKLFFCCRPPQIPENTYLNSLKDRCSEGDCTAQINLSILEEMERIEALRFDVNEIFRQINDSQDQNKELPHLDFKPKKGSYYLSASNLLLELKHNFPESFKKYEQDYDWLKKWNKLEEKLPQYPTILGTENLQINKYRQGILTFGCGHKANCSDVLKHHDELTIDLNAQIAPDLVADFRDPQLFKHFPDNHFKKIWFESMYCGDNFDTNSLNECYRILQSGGLLEFGDFTTSRLLKKPFEIDPYTFFKKIGFSEVELSIQNRLGANWFLLKAIK